MKPFIVLFIALMGCCLVSCRAKYVDNYSFQRDSLALWQWEDVIFIHEKLDSVERKPIERTFIVKQSGQALTALHQQAEHRQLIKPAPSSPTKSWWWIALGFAFAVAVALAIYSARQYLRRVIA